MEGLANIRSENIGVDNNGADSIGQVNARTCLYCQKEKVWNWNGKKLKDGSKIYIDEKNQRWAGRRCPDCEKARVYTAIRCDDFERKIILKEFEEKGFQIKSRNLPIKVEKNGQLLTVGVKRAFLNDEKVIVEGPVDSNVDVVALVFESVRVCTPKQLSQMGSTLQIYEKISD